MAKKRSRHDEETNYDVEVALALHERYNPLGVTENAVFPEDRNFSEYEPKTLIDQTLEIVDPTPNIYTLFSQFNTRFFSNKLLSVEVKWSQRMTSCAGVCSFHPRNRDCVISLSAPLLKLRPRKDLVETLLHEMIHGYLFLTNNNRDRDGHGPEFLKIMDRINKEAGTHITVYHSFHDEVKLYQQHWWRCDGPCNKRPPYFGMVRRAMNRAPGPSDFWWAGHQAKCNGTFIKVREPEKKPPRSKDRGAGNENKKPKLADKKTDRSLDDWFTKSQGKPDVPKAANDWTMGTSTSSNYKHEGNAAKVLSGGLVKLGTNTNNVHGWGTGGPGSSGKKPASSSQEKSNDKSGRTLNFTATLGGAGTGRSNLLDKFSSPSQPKRGPSEPSSSNQSNDYSPPTKKSKITDSETSENYNCPVCNALIHANLLNDHLDLCLIQSSWTVPETSSAIEIADSPEKLNNRATEESKESPTSLQGQTNLDSSVTTTPAKAEENIVACPVCDKTVIVTELYDHLDKCSPSWQGKPKSARKKSKKKSDISKGETSRRSSTSQAKTDLNDSYLCLVCNLKISSDVDLNDHLEDCVKAIFNDDKFDVGNDTFLEISSPKTNRDSENVSPESTAKVDLTNDNFPCPVCMNFIHEDLMNDHLDNCL